MFLKKNSEASAIAFRQNSAMMTLLFGPAGPFSTQ
jgi:hypothetical protein